ncbi:MAG: hypothetical protein ACI8Z1_002565 [Candidatus Azotimanducaceae bacterium]|jgi:hypothetical protein
MKIRSPLKRFFEEDISEPIIQQKCIACHKDGGLAGGTLLIYASSSVADYQGLNFSLIEAYVQEDPTRAQTILDKARGVNHGGGAQLSSGSTEFQNLGSFLDLLGVQTEVSSSLGSSLDGVTIYTPAQTLRRASVIMTGAPPSAGAVASVEAGGESALRDELIGLIAEDAFHDFLARGANDRLLTDANLGFFDAGDQNFSFFPVAANDRYEKRLAANGEQFEDVAQSHWYCGLVRAPVELIAYIVENDRNYQEVVTADYVMINKQTNIYLNAGLSFNDDDPASLFKPGKNRGQIVIDDQTVETYSEQFGKNVTARSGFIDYPHAGVLNTHSFFGRYPTTETNRNRARARWTY